MAKENTTNNFLDEWLNDSPNVVNEAVVKAEEEIEPAEHTQEDLRAIRNIPSDDPDVAIGGRAQTENHVYEFNDLGNAELFAALYPDKFRYCQDIGSWFHWNGKRWVADDLQPALYVKKSLRKYRKFMLNSGISTSRKEAIGKFVNKSLNDIQAERAVKSARVLNVFKTMYSTFDQHHFLLNCVNGVVDLRTGELLPHDLNLKLSNLAPVEYDPSAKCPEWEKAIGEYQHGNMEIINYLQELLGMCLTGNISERILPIMVGLGGNGKNAILDAVLLILGDDYAWQAPQGFLEQKKGVDFTSIELKGKRFVLWSESEKGMKLDAGLVKSMTGNKKMTAQAKHKQPCTFDITHKAILITQNPPRINETSSGMWDRVHKIDWTYQIPYEDRDGNFQDNVLKPEYPGILNWLVEGAKRWVKRGRIIKPASVRISTEEYREDSDGLFEFIQDNCITEYDTVDERAAHINEPTDVKIERGSLYKAYLNYRKSINCEKYSVGRNTFYEQIVGLGFHTKKENVTAEESGKKTTVRYFCGLRLSCEGMYSGIVNNIGQDFGGEDW